MAAEPIPYQNGINAYFNWYRDQPGVPQRGPNYDPANDTTWPWPDKLQRTFNQLKDGHNTFIADIAGLKQEVAALKQRPFG